AGAGRDHDRGLLRVGPLPRDRGGVARGTGGGSRGRSPAPRICFDGVAMIAVDPTSTLTSRDRFPCFDGLRAIAAGAVVLLHVALISGFTFREADAVGPYFAHGQAGVYLVFRISGDLSSCAFVPSRCDRAGAPGVVG